MKLVCEQETGRAAVFSLRGEMSGEDGGQLRGEAKEKLSGRVRDFVLDMSCLETIDSSGLEALCWLYEKTREQLGQLRLAGVEEHVKQILVMTRLDGRFAQCADVAAALESLG